MSSATKDEKRICPVSPFGIEIDTRGNSDVIIQSIPGCKLRGAIRGNKMLRQETDNKFGRLGDEFIPESARIFGSLPSMPGMQLFVDPAKLEYEIIDPLYDNQDLLDKFQLRAEEFSGFRTKTKLKGLSPQKGTLDVDRMKTLVREMVQLIGYEMAKIIKGVLPDMEDVDKLDGDYLLNPGSQVPNNQPTYEKDLPEYRKSLSRMGS